MSHFTKMKKGVVKSTEPAKPKGSQIRRNVGKNSKRAQDSTARAAASEKPSVCPPRASTSSPAASIQKTVRSPSMVKSSSPNVKPSETRKETKKKANQMSKEKEKEPEKKKTTIRQRKKTSSSTGSSTEGCKLEENPKITQSRSRHRIKKSKSSSSKDCSERKKKGPNLDKKVVANYFKEVHESKKSTKAATKKRTDSLRLEVMPESGQLNTSVRAMKKKLTTSLRLKASLENPSDGAGRMFRPDGQPVWVVPERMPGEKVEMTEDGVAIENPELATALAEDELEIEEKVWFETVMMYVDRRLEKGKVLSKKLQQKLDPYCDFNELEAHNEFLSQATVNYLTAETLFITSENAIRRFERKQNGVDDEQPLRPNRARSVENNGKRLVSSELASNQSNTKVTVKSSDTCYDGNRVRFDDKKRVYFSYDRRNPLASSRALMKKLKASREESIQIVAKENN